jgi:putative colanic acid biosynthesis acetyltransferase WcaF
MSGRDANEGKTTGVQAIAPALAAYRVKNFSRGRSMVVECLWIISQAMFLSSPIPGSIQRRWILRAFGARIGKNVVLKAGIKVKFPWKLEVGDFSWIGEGVWIDNLAAVRIGRNCCISQGAYLCTGSHDWSRPTFDLITREIIVEDGAWVAARTSVGLGVTVGEGTVLCLGSVATRSLLPWSIYRGNPAECVKGRSISVEEYAVGLGCRD